MILKDTGEPRLVVWVVSRGKNNDSNEQILCNKMAIFNTKIYDQKVKVQKIRKTCTKGKKMNLAGILLFIIWVSFVILSVMGWTLKTINEIKWDMDEIDKDNVL